MEGKVSAPGQSLRRTESRVQELTRHVCHGHGAAPQAASRPGPAVCGPVTVALIIGDSDATHDGAGPWARPEQAQLANDSDTPVLV